MGQARRWLGLAGAGAVVAIATAFVPPASAHGTCDVIPWDPEQKASGWIEGKGEAQCFPEVHSNWDVTTCLQFRVDPTGGWGTVTCNRVVSTQTANGIAVKATAECQPGYWRTSVTAYIGQHPGETRMSLDHVFTCDTDTTLDWVDYQVCRHAPVISCPSAPDGYSRSEQ